MLLANFNFSKEFYLGKNRQKFTGFVTEIYRCRSEIVHPLSKRNFIGRLKYTKQAESRVGKLEDSALLTNFHIFVSTGGRVVIMGQQ